MIARVTAAIRAFRAPAIVEQGNRPLGSVSPLPDSVREMARNRPAFGHRTPSSFPLVDANGVTWADRRRQQQEK